MKNKTQIILENSVKLGGKTYPKGTIFEITDGKSLDSLINLTNEDMQFGIAMITNVKAVLKSMLSVGYDALYEAFDFASEEDGATRKDIGPRKLHFRGHVGKLFVESDLDIQDIKNLMQKEASEDRDVAYIKIISKYINRKG